MHAGDRWLEGIWIGGNNYKSRSRDENDEPFYGAYPPDYLARVRAIFPDMAGRPTLHAFSGSLDDSAMGVRIDIRWEPHPGIHPTIQGDVLRLPFIESAFDLVLADTPYGQKHAKVYGTRMPSRKAALAELARVTTPGGFLVWLDTKLPIFRKVEWNWVGIVMVVRSTNHDYRGAAIFQRCR